MNEITISKLSVDNLEDFTRFFDKRAFCDNPDWAACFCMFYQVQASLDNWMKRTGIQNREEAVRQINDGRLKGYLAYFENKPVGFCNANAKRNLFFDKYRMECNNTGTEGIFSLVCFVIDPAFRRQGISKRFLERLVEDFKKSDFSILEAYPSAHALETKDNYHGYMKMYRKFGFKEVLSFEKFSVMQLFN